MNKTDLKNSPKVLGLDISTKTIGWSLFDIRTQELLELTHFSPVIKPKPEDKIEELILKVRAFEEKLEGYRYLGITKVIIEEPLPDIEDAPKPKAKPKAKPRTKKAPIEVIPEIKEEPKQEPLPTKSDESQITPQEETKNEKVKKVIEQVKCPKCDKTYEFKITEIYT